MILGMFRNAFYGYYLVIWLLLLKLVSIKFKSGPRYVKHTTEKFY